uniref:Uncharacterized protein n=1 Tax=Wolfiporia cocos TaxID=81056 RepID=A0A7G7YDS9_9APHY|nr:hypothetical protein [Wolfiporia cocos]QNH92649.1 hypothetical protein [Wolfiporia cocos]
MQELDTSYNMQKYSNYGGGPNKGATGIVRDEAFRNKVSHRTESHQGRTYSDYTNDLHRNNMLGKSYSDETRAKMSQSSGGVLIHYYSYESNIFGTFITKTAAAQTLGVSIRTISRWCEIRLPKVTKPRLLVLLVLCAFCFLLPHRCCAGASSDRIRIITEGGFENVILGYTPILLSEVSKTI